MAWLGLSAWPPGKRRVTARVMLTKGRGSGVSTGASVNTQSAGRSLVARQLRPPNSSSAAAA
jgi:hypothetical protein